MILEPSKELMTWAQESSFTDWIQAVSSGIAIPAALYGIFNLFRKDEDKQKQINSLEALARSQILVIDQMKQQLQEFSMQTKEMQAQTKLVDEGNQVLKDQLNTQVAHYGFQQNTEITRRNKAEADRKAAIRPNLIFDSSYRVQDVEPPAMRIKLSNVGSGEAQEIEVGGTGQQTDWIKITYSTNHAYKLDDVSENGWIVFSITVASGIVQNSLSGFFIRLLYKDVDGNSYNQTLQHSFKAGSDHFTITDPLAVSE